MTKLLISVRDAAEAEAAIDGGADLIDVKEPRHGSLGRASNFALREIAAAVAGRKPLSAAFGEVAEQPPEHQPIPTDYAFAKVGLAGAATNPQWPQQWAEVVARLPKNTSPVAVVYADGVHCEAPSFDEIMPVARALSCRVILVDTFHKDGRTLLNHWSDEQLVDFITTSRQQNMMSVLAGSLDFAAVQSVLDLTPDYVAIRSAVCRGGRTGAVDRALVAEFAIRTRNASEEVNRT